MRKTVLSTPLLLGRDGLLHSVSGAIALKGPAYLEHCAFKAEEETARPVGWTDISEQLHLLQHRRTSGTSALEEISA